MKRYIVAAALLLVALFVSGQVVVYEDDARIEWEPTTRYDDGLSITFLPGDVLQYEVYYYDVDNPVIDNQDIAQLQYAGATTNTEYDFTFPDRRQWAVGVRSHITDGGGTSGPYSLIGWSNTEEAVNVAVMGGPFIFVPLFPMIAPAAPGSLQDQRY